MFICLNNINQMHYISINHFNSKWLENSCIFRNFKWHFVLYRCNDGSPGELAVDGDGQCVNMNLLLGKKERVSN